MSDAVLIQRGHELVEADADFLQQRSEDEEREQAEAAMPERTYSWLEFMDLFTEAEEVQIVGASMSDVDVKRWYDRAQGSGGIKLSDPRVNEGLKVLVDANLLTEVRRAQVVAGETQKGT